MQPDASVEFQNVNALRRFPLAEDQSAMGNDTIGDLGTELPNDLVVDFKAFSCGAPLDDDTITDPENGLRYGARLVAIVGPDSGRSSLVEGNTLNAASGEFRFYFALGTKREVENYEQWLMFSVPTASMVEGHSVSSRVEFASSSAGWTTMFAGGQFRLGPGAASWASDHAEDSWVANGHGGEDPPSDGAPSALLEPSLVSRFFTRFVGPLSVETPSGSVQVTGRGTIIPGYNMIARAGEDSIELTPERGAGLGVPPESVGSSESTGDDGDCVGNINHINGERPTVDGDFFIKGEQGILVEEDKEGHRILLSIYLDEGVACEVDETIIETTFFRYTEGTYTIPASTGFLVRRISGSPVIGDLSSPSSTTDNEARILSVDIPEWHVDYVDPVLERCHESFVITVPAGAEAVGYFRSCGGEAEEEETDAGTEIETESTDAEGWIIEDGVWNDEALWLDDGVWND